MKWWQDADNFRRWETWQAARRGFRSLPTLGDWLFSMALAMREDGPPHRASENPPWERKP